MRTTVCGRKCARSWWPRPSPCLINGVQDFRVEVIPLRTRRAAPGLPEPRGAVAPLPPGRPSGGLLPEPRGAVAPLPPGRPSGGLLPEPRGAVAPLPPERPSGGLLCPRHPQVSYSGSLCLLTALSQCPFNLKLCFSRPGRFPWFFLIIPCPTRPWHTG